MSLVNYLFPKQCVLCSRIGEDICNSCIKKLIHKLPSCYICKGLNNNYLTHHKCLEKPIQYFTGWYLSKDLEIKLRKKRLNSLFSIYEYLLRILILYLDIQNLVDSSYIYPILSSKKDEYRLNRFLAKKFNRYGKDKKSILYIGGYESDIQDTIDRTKGLHSKEPFDIYFLVLFELTPKRTD